MEARLNRLYRFGGIFIRVLIARNKDVRDIAGYFLAAFAILILSGTATSADSINELQDGSNLKYSNLQGANLSMAHLNRSDLSYSLLQGSDLSSAQMAGADLSFVTAVSANFSASKMNRVRLHSSDLSKANFTKETGRMLATSVVRGRPLLYP